MYHQIIILVWIVSAVILLFIGWINKILNIIGLIQVGIYFIITSLLLLENVHELLQEHFKLIFPCFYCDIGYKISYFVFGLITIFGVIFSIFFENIFIYYVSNSLLAIFAIIMLVITEFETINLDYSEFTV